MVSVLSIEHLRPLCALEKNKRKNLCALRGSVGDKKPMMQRYIIFENLSVNKCFNFVRMCIIF